MVLPVGLLQVERGDAGVDLLAFGVSMTQQSLTASTEAPAFNK